MKKKPFCDIIITILGGYKLQIKDKAIIFKGLYQEVKLMIDNIKEIGFDVKEFDNQLSEIYSRVQEIANKTNSSVFEESIHSNNYTTGIYELNNLKNNLEKYNLYFKVLNSCKWLQTMIKNTSITKEELNQYVNQMEENLNQIVHSNTMDYDNEKHVVELVYKVAYEIIKLELLINDRSNLYEYVKNEDSHISYFNSIIKQEIQTINSKSSKNANTKKMLAILNEKELEIRKKGIDNNYFDIELIKFLLVINNPKYEIMISSRIHDTSNLIESKSSELQLKVNDYNNSLEEKETTIREKKNSRKTIVKNVSAIILATAIAAGCGFAIKKIVRKANIKNKYIVQSETFSLIDDNKQTESSYLFSDKEPEDEVFIRIPIGEETVQIFDVSFLNCDNTEEYYEQIKKNYGQLFENLKTDDKENQIIDLVRNSYEYDSKELDTNSNNFALFLSYSAYILLLVILESVYLSKEKKTFYYDKITEIKEKINYLSNNKNSKETNDKMEQLRKEIFDMINEQTILKERFIELYKDYNYLLLEPEELYERVKSIDANNKELTKSLNLE